MNRANIAFLLLCGLFSGCAGLTDQPGLAPSSSTPGAAASSAQGVARTDPQISATLIDVLEHKDRLKVDLTQVQGTPLGEMLTVGSPIGYILRTRYLNLGIPIADGLSRDPDPVFREKLVTLARWDSNPEVRSAALVTVAQAHKLEDYEIFTEALVYLNPAVRFGALEALLVWGHPEKTLPLLTAFIERDRDPILQVYAAGGLAKLGDRQGHDKLVQFLDSPSWLARAMAGRFLGEYGTDNDYAILVSRIGREQSNDFVLAEYCIAALKLFGKKHT